MLLRTFSYLAICKSICLLVGMGCLAYTYMLKEKVIEYTAPIVFIVDVSHSMNSTDMLYDNIPTSRLAVATKKIEKRIDGSSTQQAIGLIVCNDESCVYAIPPTTHHSYIHSYLAYIHTNMIQHAGPLLSLDQDTRYIFLSDGSTGENFNNNIKKTLGTIAHSLQIIGIGSETASNIVDPAGKKIAGSITRHGYNASSLAAVKASTYSLLDDNVFNTDKAYSKQEQGRIFYLGIFLIALGL